MTAGDNTTARVAILSDNCLMRIRSDPESGAKRLSTPGRLCGVAGLRPPVMRTPTDPLRCRQRLEELREASRAKAEPSSDFQPRNLCAGERDVTHQTGIR